MAMKFDNSLVVLSRDVVGVQIPDGNKVNLPEGTHVTLHQELGGSYTVGTELGYLVRINGEDADALGKEVQKHVVASEGTDPASVEKNIWEVLKTCYDPEIPINIVELGLVYECKVNPIGEGMNDVQIKMTLTAPGCGMGPVLQTDVETKVKSLPGVNKTNVEVVFEPAWDREMMSEAAKLQLGLL
jgi:probable FeS assembly SUF system protein SufT